MPKNVEMPVEDKAKFLLDAAEDRKAVDPVLIDLRGKSTFTDYFLICTGTSDVHIRAIADSVQEKAEEARFARPRVEGQAVGEWVLIDFGDVVVHVMGQEPRDRFRLEQFWTTPQPKGALPPTPDSIAANGGLDVEVEADFDDDQGDESDLDDLDLDDDELAAASFFEEADKEVEPVDEEQIDDDGGTGGGRRQSR